MFVKISSESFFEKVAEEEKSGVRVLLAGRREELFWMKE
jgi:hypothetical protein